MKSEESPDISKRNMERGTASRNDMKLFQQINCTPKGKKIGLDDLHLLGLHRDCSPNAYGSSQDGWEIVWGDSPEPLRMEQKTKLITTPVACKKRLESRESPKSTCRNIRPMIKPPSKQPVDVSKYIAEVQELSKRIMNEIENDKQPDPGEKKENSSNESSSKDVLDFLNEDNLTNEYLISCSMSLDKNLDNLNENPSNQRVEKERKSFGGTHSAKQYQTLDNSNDHLTSNYDSAFEKVLQSFINEEDDWLAQVVLNTEAKITPRKNGFIKTKSENQLNSTDQNSKTSFPISRRSSGLTSAFRRTYSSDRVESSNYSKVNSDSINSNNTNGTGRISVRRTNFLSGRSQSSQRKYTR